MIRIVGPLLLLTLQYLVYRKARTLLRESGTGNTFIHVLGGVFIAMNGLTIAVMLSSARLLDLPAWIRYFTLYPLFIWQGSTFFLGLLLFVGSMFRSLYNVLRMLLRLIPPVRKRSDQENTPASGDGVHSSRRAFLRKGAYAVAGVSFAGTSYGMLVERRKADITTAEFVLDSLDPGLDGFTIGLVSDIHSSINMPLSEMKRYVTVMNSLGCDMIVVDGDFINSSVDEVFPFAEAFSGLRAPFGVFGVMGNHDYYNKNPNLVAREVNGCGIRLLFDEGVPISRNGASFSLLGIDDTGNRESAIRRMKAAIGASPANQPRILLCHRPYFLPEASDLGINLVLSGHTHGGQIVFGRVGGTVFAPASLASPYVWGTYHKGRCSMYVSRGIGTVGVPVRINCPPEITRVVLRSRSSKYPG